MGSRTIAIEYIYKDWGSTFCGWRCEWEPAFFWKKKMCTYIYHTKTHRTHTVKEDLSDESINTLIVWQLNWNSFVRWWHQSAQNQTNNDHDDGDDDDMRKSKKRTTEEEEKERKKEGTKKRSILEIFLIRLVGCPN